MTDTGRDVYCLQGFRRNMPEVSGDEAIAQLAARGLSKSPDRLPFIGWGIDMRQFVLSKAPLSQIQAAAEQQVLTDERVRACTATASREEKLIKLTLAVVKDEGGTLTFTLSITQAAVDLIRLQG